MCVSYIRNRFIGLTILHDIPSVYSLAPYSNGSILFLSDSSFIVSPRLHAGRSALFDLVIFTCHPWLWRSHVVPPDYVTTDSVANWHPFNSYGAFCGWAVWGLCDL